MKKFLLSFFAFASVLFMSSCGDVYKTEIVKEGVDLFTDYVTATADSWTYFGNEGELGCLIYQDFEFPEISNKVMDEGLVTVYFCAREQEGNDFVDRDHPLPYVFTVENEHHQVISQNIRYAVERGFLRVIVEWSDSKTYLQDDMQFKVCIMSPGK